MAVLVLAGNLWEANAYGREKGFRVRFATGPEIIQAANRIVELPSFRARRDRFAMQAALNARLRYGKGVDYEFASDWTYERPKSTDAEVVPKIDDKSRRETLVDAFDAATEALAADMQMTSEDLIRYTVGLLDKVEPSDDQEQLPLNDPAPESVKKAAPPRKRAAKKAAPKPPVVDAPVEF